MAKPWYARTSWSPDDREDFLARLRAVAGDNEQVSILRKQAGHLLKARTPEALAGAQELYELLLAQFPNSSDTAYAHAALGECLERQGEPDRALAAYVRALDAQRGRTRTTNAHLRFGLLVIALGRYELHEVAMRLLDEFGQALIYPLEQYQQCGIKAVIHATAGRQAPARLCALDALAAAKHCAPPEDTVMHRLLVELCAAAPKT